MRIELKKPEVTNEIMEFLDNKNLTVGQVLYIAMVIIINSLDNNLLEDKDAIVDMMSHL